MKTQNLIQPPFHVMQTSKIYLPISNLIVCGDFQNILCAALQAAYCITCLIGCEFDTRPSLARHSIRDDVTENSNAAILRYLPL